MDDFGFHKRGSFYQEFAIRRSKERVDTLYSFYMGFDSIRYTYLNYDPSRFAVFVARKAWDSGRIVTEKLRHSLFVVPPGKHKPKRPAGFDSLFLNSSSSSNDGSYAGMSGENFVLYTHDRKKIITRLNAEGRLQDLGLWIKRATGYDDITLVSILSSSDTVQVSVIH